MKIAFIGSLLGMGVIANRALSNTLDSLRDKEAISEAYHAGKDGCDKRFHEKMTVFIGSNRIVVYPATKPRESLIDRYYNAGGDQSTVKANLVGRTMRQAHEECVRRGDVVIVMAGLMETANDITKAVDYAKSRGTPCVLIHSNGDVKWEVPIK